MMTRRTLYYNNKPFTRSSPEMTLTVTGLRMILHVHVVIAGIETTLTVQAQKLL